MEKVVLDLRCPTDKSATPQLPSPAKSSDNDSSSDDESVSRDQLDRVQGQLNELRCFVNSVIKQQAK